MDTDIFLWQLRRRWWPLCSSGSVSPCSPHKNMFNLMSNCCSWISEFQQPIRKVNVLVVGLDKAGKTSTIRGMLRVPSGDMGSVFGCVRTELRVENFLVTLLDMGGDPDVRGSWRDLCGEVHGIIFVVDSSDRQRIKEAKELLTELLKHPRVAGKPLLVLANKQDKMNALLGSEIIEILSLERLVNQSRSLCHIEPCSALMDMRKWTDRKTLRGLRWLLRAINLDYPELCSRITRDIKDRRAHAPEERDRCGKMDRCRGKPREKTHVSKKVHRPREKHQRPKTPSLQPIRNILKKESTLNKKLKKKKKKQVKIKDMEEKSRRGEETEDEQDEEGGRGSVETDPENGVQKEKASTPLITPKRGKLKSKVKVTEENPESVENEDKDKSNKENGEKKKKKKVVKVKKKNKINTEELPVAYSQPVDLSATFDLYRKAILALREQQDQGR
ncbi:ADP-ribosylation factor-like protein 13A [Esox lucius]|nr:ADP-ribosylation factor-like protein 13A [Esox lucius]